MNQTQHKDGGQFALGLVLGFLAGSTSYFLFTTQQGRELKKHLREQWQEIEAKIPSATQLKIGDLKLSELLAVILGLDQTSRSSNQKLSLIQESNRRHTTQKIIKPKKFKGL